MSANPVGLATILFPPILDGGCDHSTQQDFLLSFNVALDSPHSRAAYSRAVASFVAWREMNAPGKPLSRNLVLRYRAAMDVEGPAQKKVATATINLRLAALRHLAREAELAGLISTEDSAGILAIRGVKMSRVREGKWLSNEETKALLKLPNRSTLRGVRDHAILMLLFGCGLRRAELASLCVGQIAEQDGTIIIRNLIGKGNKTRQVQIPNTVYNAIELWLRQSRIEDGRLFRAVNRGSNVWGSGLRPETILEIVRYYAEQLSKLSQGNLVQDRIMKIRPHDARRTFAKLCRKQKGSLEEVQKLLGHQSITTTMLYLGDDDSEKTINHNLEFLQD
jgi:integrase